MADLLVLWDVDYTLVGADGLGTRLYEVVFREMFGRELTEVAPKAGRTDRAIVGDTLARAGVPLSAVGPFLAALERVAADGAVPGPVRPLPGAAEAIAALASAGIRQSLLTGNVRPLAALKLRRAGLGAGLDLDAGAYGDVHEVRAELVTAARSAARQAYGLDFPGTATVLVGDTPLDVEAALATGARAVARRDRQLSRGRPGRGGRARGPARPDRHRPAGRRRNRPRSIGRRRVGCCLGA